MCWGFVCVKASIEERGQEVGGQSSGLSPKSRVVYLTAHQSVASQKGVVRVCNGLLPRWRTDGRSSIHPLMGCLHHTVQCSSQQLGSSQTTEWCRYSLWCSYRIPETVPGHLAAWTHCARRNLTPCAVSFTFFLLKVRNIFLALEPLRTGLLFSHRSARYSKPLSLCWSLSIHKDSSGFIFACKYIAQWLNCIKFCDHWALVHTVAPVKDAWLLSPLVILHSVIVKNTNQ